MSIGRDVLENLGDVETILHLGNTYNDPDLYYLTKFLAMDDFIYLNHGGKEHLIVGNMEAKRAKKESRVKNIETRESLSVEADSEGREERLIKTVRKILDKEGSEAQKLGVLKSLPTGVFVKLKEEFNLKVIENPVQEMRTRKDSEEIENIRKAQRAAGQSINKAKEILESSRVEDGKILFKGEQLTSGILRKKIEHFLLDNELELVDSIVASGKKSSQPHYTGQSGDPIKPTGQIRLLGGEFQNEFCIVHALIKKEDALRRPDIDKAKEWLEKCYEERTS